MTDQSMPKKQKLDARKCHKYFDLLCDDVVVFVLLFLGIDELFGIMRVTKYGVFSRCLGKAFVLFPDVKLWDSDPWGRRQAVVKHCPKLRIVISHLDDLDVSAKIISNAWHTLSGLDISLTCMLYVLAAGVTLRRLKELKLLIYGEDEILFRTTDFPNLTLLDLRLPDGDVHKSFISFTSSELQKFRLLESLTLVPITSRAVIDMLEPPPNLKHLTILIDIHEDFDISCLSGKFPRLESLALWITNCARTAGLTSFLNGIPPLKNINHLPDVSSIALHVLNRSRDTLMKWRDVQRVMGVLDGQDIVFPQLTEITFFWHVYLNMESSEILARVAPNMTSLNVNDLAGESLDCLHKHGINLKSLTIRGRYIGRGLGTLADATVFPGLMSLRIRRGTSLAARQHIRNVRKDCVVSQFW